MHEDALVHPKERLYFTIALVFSVLVYAGMIVSIVGLFYLLFLGAMGTFAQGLMVGHIRGAGVKVGPRQFADVYATTQRLAREMGMREVPDVYILQAGGILNAFATRFLGRDFVILYSDVVELAREQGDDALAFVICHELAHHHRGHLSRRPLLLPAMVLPLLATAYSRACEYTCDAYGARYCGNGAVDGLLVLAAGKTLYREVDAEAFARQAIADGGFFVWLAEKLSTHPHLPNRVSAVLLRLRPRVQVGALHGYDAAAYSQPVA